MSVIDTTVLHPCALSLAELVVIERSLDKRRKYHSKSIERLVRQINDEPATPARLNALDHHRLGLLEVKDVLDKISTLKASAEQRESDIVRLRKGADSDA